MKQLKKFKRSIAKRLWYRNRRQIDTLKMLPVFDKFRKTNTDFCVVRNKLELQKWIANYVGLTNAIDYLEFGVFEGESLSFWLEANTNQKSRFVGFDSFEGLPENWVSGFEKGTFNQNGMVPDFGDSRASCVKGWFQETLRGFTGSFEPSRQLVIYHDADLYSSTLYCLAETDHLIRPGSIIILDDFGVLLHVFRAYHDYCKANCRSFELLCATPEMTMVALRLLPTPEAQS